MPRRKRLPSSAPATSAASWPRCAARNELGDVVLFDIPEKEGVAKGKALDLEQNGAVLGYDADDHRQLQLGRLRRRRRRHHHRGRAAQAGHVARRSARRST